MKKQKILYISDTGTWGGAQKVTLTLIKGLNRQQYELHFILGSDGLFAQALQSEGVSVYIAPMTPMSVPKSQRYLLPLLLVLFLGRILGYIWQTYWIIRRIHPDLIQTCSIQAKLIGSIVAKLSRTKVLWHVQNMQPVGFRRKLVRFMACHFPDQIVATSYAVAAIYGDVVSADKLYVNHAGVDLTELTSINRHLARQMVEQERGVTQQRIVVFASMLRSGKGPHILIQAAAEISKVLPNVVYLLVGEAQFSKDRAYKKVLLDLISQLGLNKQIKLLGFRKDVYQLIAAADCLVHCPTENDSLPTVVLKTMALQTPVVGTAIGGIPEEIDHQVTGLLVEPGNASELAQAVSWVLNNPETAHRWAEAARRKVEAEFSQPEFVQRFEEIYAKLLFTN